jgi:hypothetical protein
VDAVSHGHVAISSTSSNRLLTQCCRVVCMLQGMNAQLEAWFAGMLAGPGEICHH